MALRGIMRAVTGLATGALLTAVLVGLLALAWLAGAPFVPFTVFEWLIRVLPGPMVTFGLDLTLRVLQGLGFNVADTAKTAEWVLAAGSLFLAGLIIGLLFFVLLCKTGKSRLQGYGLAVGGAVGLFSVATTLTRGVPAGVASKVGFAILGLVLFCLWGWAMARLYLLTIRGVAAAPAPETLSPAFPPAPMKDIQASPPVDVQAFPDAEARAISRRRFIVQMGGLAATIVVVGAGVGDLLHPETTPAPAPGGGPGAFPNAGSPVNPVPGTRPEYTPVADHYRVDIDLTTPELDASGWRLVVNGLVAKPLSLTLDQLKSGYKAVDQFVTLLCISNMLGGPFIDTTLWTGAPFRDVLADAGPAAEARFARMTSPDGYDEEIDLALVNRDPRILLAYAWDRHPLTRQHGFPLRVYIPDRYGMKQPKWITKITLTADSTPGYLVARGWDQKAEVRTTSVIDTVATKSLVTSGGQIFVPIGGIAYSGAKGISKVEIQIDAGPWRAAELRQPLSELTWVIWRFDWPFSAGTHRLTVRAYDGLGRLQETKEVPPSGVAATGLYSEQRTIAP
jgi:DMSO/TMAO reductase YedYZ molybdopterin-dependent catalytic subunit